MERAKYTTTTMATGHLSLAKDVYNLLRNIDSMSGGQAKVLEWDEDNMGYLIVEVAPADGYYRNGKFKFKIDINVNDYPNNAPAVNCITPIYHPNIDTVTEELWPREEVSDPAEEEYSFKSSNVCLSIFELSVWNNSMHLEDCIQGLLFLFYNPNFEDPLTPLFDATTCNDMEEFAENVSLSLLGGNVEGVEYKTNYGLAEACHTVKDILTDIIDQVVPAEDFKEIEEGKGEVLQSENKTEKLAGTEVLCQDIISDLLQQICDENENEQKDHTDYVDLQKDGQEELIDIKVKVSECQQNEDKVVTDQFTEEQNSISREVQGCDKTVDTDNTQVCHAKVSEKDKEVDNAYDIYSEVKNLNENQNVINASMICDNKKLVLRSDSYIEKCNNIEKLFTSDNDDETKESVQKLDITKLPSSSV